MKNRIKLSLYVAVIIIAASLILQYFLVDKMFNTEHDNIKVRASLVLNDVLSLDLKRLGIERHDILIKNGVDVENEGWGGNFENKTVIVHVAYPEQKRIIRECKTEEEWYEYMKDTYCRYHITGVNLSRLDSAYKVALEKHSIFLPFVLVKFDSTNTILKQIPADVDYNNYRLSADTIPLGIDGKDFLVARFDSSYYGMFRQMRFILIASFVIVFLLAFITIYLLRTIFYQKKIAEVREDLVNSIVHDLKNPVLFLNKVLPRIKTDESQQKYIDTAKYKSERLSQMIDKLLTTSSMDKGLSINPQFMPVSEFVGSVVEQYKADNEKLNILFLSETNEIANIDRLHFCNALNNLIDNAIKYSEENAEIIVKCFKDNNYICISVRDCGIGIPKEFLKHLFEKHFRVPTNMSLPRTGFGLGLSYVMIVAKAHDGDVTVKSEYKKGSEFIITIPLPNNN